MQQRSVFLSTNVVGGLGNQLFLLANLHATALRLRQTAAEPLVVTAHVAKDALSSSCHEPRPTYWHTGLMSNVNRAIVDSISLSSSARNDVITVPELGADAAPFTLDALDKHRTLLPSSSSFNFVGFFQSDRYFSDVRDAVVDTLRPPHVAEMASTAMKRICRQHTDEQHVVGMHVRRGDYLLLKETFEILPHDYYFRSLETLFGRMLFTTSSARPRPPVKVLLFSEDKFFAKILSGALQVRFPAVEAAVVDAKDEDAGGHTEWQTLPVEVKEMLLLAVCDDIVIANSSFSWWSAYFAQTSAAPGRCRVVAPQKWFVGKDLPELAHIYSPDWIVL
jgi:hypothetical protein